jgi:DNA-binding transcriptional ArsR family regulator
VNNNAGLDRSFVALAHPARRAIVERLARGPATVGQAASTLSLSKPAITKHVKVLERAGVVSRTIEGRRHRLELRPRGIDDALRWMERHRRVWEELFEAVDRRLDEGR